MSLLNYFIDQIFVLESADVKTQHLFHFQNISQILKWDKGSNKHDEAEKTLDIIWEELKTFADKDMVRFIIDIKSVVRTLK